MKRIAALLFAAAAIAMCAEKTYTITLYSPTIVGNTELKAGAYKFMVVDQNVVITGGKTETRIPVKVETVKDKFDRTSIRVNNADGKARVDEIRLGGTNTKLVLPEASGNAGN